MPALSNDRAVLRELARRYADLSRDPVQDRRRDLWRRHNALQPTPPLIYVRAFAADELDACRCTCIDPLLRGIEYGLRIELCRTTFGDDSIFEPWVTVRAVYAHSAWGVATPHHVSEEARGSFKVDYPIKSEADLERLVPPRHAIDEAATATNLARVQEAIGDLITINLDRGPTYLNFSGDLSTWLGHLRGIEHFMLDMADRPEWLHRLLAFMRDGILANNQAAEDAGNYTLTSGYNQAMTYAEGFDPPCPNSGRRPRRALWGFGAAQEYTLVSPAFHEEFIFRYQKPIIEHFGLAHYGCCEDLGRKIGLLRTLKNLRSIAVTPVADVRLCAEQIGADYVIAWRPNPTDMVCCGYDEGRVRHIITEGLAACRGGYPHIQLKDIETVEGDTSRLSRWVRLVRDIADSPA
jgi:hypothetical protein